LKALLDLTEQYAAFRESFVDGEAVLSDPEACSCARIEASRHWQAVIHLIAADCSAGDGPEVAINRTGVIAEPGEAFLSAGNYRLSIGHIGSRPRSIDGPKGRDR
jgi:hypothetical protein